LLIDWREGEKYFEEMLIDYDEASNIGGCQWVSSTGTDAVPYFRIFNSEGQLERFDSSDNCGP
jgi:deoxyribodipyrimidine photo-lyase